MLHDISNGVVKLVLPEFGKVEISTEDLVQDKGGALRPYTFSWTYTQKQLSFHGFLPQIRRYRRSLLEVLVVSLVFQLLNLAQPLVFQQIFDKLSANKILILYIHSVCFSLVCPYSKVF